MTANIPVPVLTKTGMNARDFYDDRYEEEFECHLNLIDDLKVELCTPAMVEDLSVKMQSLKQSLPPGKFFGKISFTVQKTARPMHRGPLCDYIDDSESQFLRRPWLITTTPRGEIKHNQVYDTTSSKLPRGQFTTIKSHEESYMAALLYERDEVREAKKLIFNYTTRSPAEFSLLSGSGIKPKRDIGGQGVAKIVQSPHTTIAVLLADF
ncbi:hypothetical protein LTR97_007737 [Elasticomyces elasticus]|uniref:Uncharacterized protein n=1 Tax=Elasticomyces elasticus TaxID=574655 RepID=A0AAN7W7H2_9PEZI|nr:hypothetical protein LTR97_007737 [Elasticomyces elasticus]